MKKFVFGVLACVTLLAVSCEPSNTAEEDSLYETNSIDKATAEIDGGRRG
ncbi:hypothetical protein FK220_012485 [Flavobacteriaceae bacterium TP-CH-4]|uniref:Uncharacterized protein n=1 Tax=Pelagihabitans pacificus TaxID=2696054 RepID=A0A967E662_9FLAO|nr:hypothetical protein [Pelagihabitans pacificus]NHF60167.1 hypothetical protein [Pelagihabitans pacificus]